MLDFCPTMEQMDLSNKRVLVRVDFNVPLDGTKILSTARIDAVVDTIKQLQLKKAKIILMSHLGRPKGFDVAFSLQPVVDYLAKVLNTHVALFNLGDPMPEIVPGGLAVLENVRFYPGETDNCPTLAKRYAQLCDVFIMDAFGVAHRAHASTTGVIQAAKQVCMGPLLANEMTQLDKALASPERPLLAIVGGGKVSTKLAALQYLVDQVDSLIVGGALANTFLLAKGYNIGASRVEEDLVSVAKAIMDKAQSQGKTFWLPSDVRVAKSFDSAFASIRPCAELDNDDMILDIGRESEQSLSRLVQSAKTIVWNGPMGVFEKPAFSEGTRTLALAIAKSPAYAIAGGGETIAAIEQSGVASGLSYISTGGGAFLAVLEGKVLPVIEAIKAKINESNVKTVG